LKPKLTIVLALIVITPLAIVGWLGVRIVRSDQAVVEHGFRELIFGQLRAVDGGLARALESYRDAVIGEMTPLATDRDTLRRRGRESPYVLQYFVTDADGRFVFPPVGRPLDLTAAERRALERTRQVWDGGALAGVPGETEGGSSLVQSGSDPPSTGWHAWYWGNGLQLLLWARDGARLHVAEINRARLVADLVGSLPETDGLSPELARGRIRFVDAAGRLMYEWGAFEPGDDAAPVARLALKQPLGAWSLEYFAAEDVFGSSVAGGLVLNLVAGLAVLAAAIIGLTYYFYREQSREMREAAQRVSFVNQVSHELKTPLTNIRMYAELLEQDLGDRDEQVERHLGVIVGESQRLSRLIGNVLTFGRKQRGALKLHRESGAVDDVLRAVLDHFGPALETRDIQVSFQPFAGRAVSLDPDAVEQIVGNLISNVEKYGACGKRLELISRQTGDTVEIVVADHGPGLPSREHRRIFEPFYRVSNPLTEGVGGTGIGLAISRDLARLHGGDLRLEPSERGARFLVTLHCPRVANGA
jgi:signal transduction histidine kinase